LAVLKHLTIKKRDYGDIQRYLLFKCEEGTHKPIRDEARRMVPRDFYIQDGINCDPFSFDAECAELNRRFHKNQRKGEIMAHHYIISFDPKDATENGLTPRQAHFKRGRYSFTHPKREKPIAGRSLGNAYQREAILEKVQMNQLHAVEDRPELAALPRIFLIPSDLRLVVDLQTCVKAQQSRAYARKVALSNLQRMARTVAWIQENGMGTIDTLALAKEGTAKQHQEVSSQLRRAEADLRLVNRKIKHIGRYHSNRKLYARYGQTEDKDRFRAERRSEIEAYEESARELKSLFPDGNYPTLRTLRETKAALMEQRDRLKADLKPLAAEKKQLEIVWKNVHAIFGSDRGIEVEQPTERSRQSIPTR